MDLYIHWMVSMTITQDNFLSSNSPFNSLVVEVLIMMDRMY